MPLTGGRDIRLAILLQADLSGNLKITSSTQRVQAAWRFGPQSIRQAQRQRQLVPPVATAAAAARCVVRGSAGRSQYCSVAEYAGS